MNAYLLIDFGSTYTKLTAVNIESEEILATAKGITTIEDDIMIGFEKAYSELKLKINTKMAFEKINFINKIACSSAGGGLKIYAIGLVLSLTAEAAKKAALGAGARVMKTYSYDLNNAEIKEIENSDADIILLAGGTNGGNKNCILHNARLIAKSKIKVPIVIAGNTDAHHEIVNIFDSAKIDYTITENVLPTLDNLNVKPAREAIRNVFMTKIVEAKGLKKAESFINGIVMPTPAAVLDAAELLSKGTDKEEGLGDLIIVDIGGATTDIHSLAQGDPTKMDVIPKGLPEPFAKRTVEGDLGMRYSSLSLLEAVKTKKIRSYLNDTHKEIDIKKHCNYRHKNIMMVPQTYEETIFDEAMAAAATEAAMTRHCGWIENLYTPMGTMYFQCGKDLMDIRYVIGTGGVIVHSQNQTKILKAGEFDITMPIHLRPRKPNYLVDNTYILSAMGLLVKENPNLALRIMKKYLKKAN
ncbi:MAG: methylaspartate mutase accessory protein GlmL [Psychrilyobacter sp.]|uniref:methylaspartate mutase accessory protein GlmL n=1 Tax=Psychrilyobacter sp. TaxID=2586924 RepID=UPI003C708B17